MNTKHARQKAGRSFRLSTRIIILLLSIVIFAIPSPPRNSGEAIKVSIYTYVRPADSPPFTAGKPISAEVTIGPYTATTKTEGGEIGTPPAILTVPPGRYKVKARAQGYIVKEVYFSASYLAGGIPGSDMAGVPAASTEGDIEIEVLGVPEEYPQNDTGTLSFTFIEDPNKKEEKAFRVFAVSVEYCKDFDWKSLHPAFTRNERSTSFDLTETGEDLRLEPGTYQLDLSHVVGRGSDAPELSKVVVSQRFKSSTREVEFLPSEAGKVKVNLEKEMWEGENVPEIKLYFIGLCGEVAQIELITGQAWIDLPNSTSRKAVKQDTVHVGETIRTLAGSSVELKTPNGYLIIIGEKTKLAADWGKTESGIRHLEYLIAEEGGNIQVIRSVDNKSSKSNFSSGSETTGINVKTPTATVTDKETNYTVGYDQSSKATTVGVVEGKVEVTPMNPSLQSFTLAANQQVQVTEKSISAITSYSGAGKTGRILLYVGIGVTSLLALVALLFFFRRQRRRAMQPAFLPAGVKPPGWSPPANVAPPVVNQAWQSCPNPQCGKETRSGKKFCAHCGTRLSS